MSSVRRTELKERRINEISKFHWDASVLLIGIQNFIGKTKGKFFKWLRSQKGTHLLSLGPILVQHPPLKNDPKIITRERGIHAQTPPNHNGGRGRGSSAQRAAMCEKFVNKSGIGSSKPQNVGKTRAKISKYNEILARFLVRRPSSNLGSGLVIYARWESKRVELVSFARGWKERGSNFTVVSNSCTIYKL